MAMKLRNLGDSNLKVSPVCLGTMYFGTQTGQAQSTGASATRPIYLLVSLPLEPLQMLHFKWSGICGSIH